MCLSLRYVPPSADASQDIRGASLTRVDGVNTLRFTKTINSRDEEVRIPVKKLLKMISIFLYFRTSTWTARTYF